MKKHPLTQEQYDNMLEELNELVTKLIPENSDAIKAAKEQGDLSENAEYDAAKELQAKLHARLSEINTIKDNCFIIQKNENLDIVDIGHTVKVERLNDKTVLDLQILGQWDLKSTTTSISSPLGKALLGKRVNEQFSIEAPIGELSFKVLEIY